MHGPPAVQDEGVRPPMHQLGSRNCAGRHFVSQRRGIIGLGCESAHLAWCASSLPFSFTRCSSSSAAVAPEWSGSGACSWRIRAVTACIASASMDNDVVAEVTGRESGNDAERAERCAKTLAKNYGQKSRRGGRAIADLRRRRNGPRPYIYLRLVQ